MRVVTISELDSEVGLNKQYGVVPKILRGILVS